MISIYLGGFIVGILLGKSGIFLYPQKAHPAIVAGIILLLLFLVSRFLLKKEKRYLYGILSFLLGFFWGNSHSAPMYAGSCQPFELLETNPLQFKRGPAIISVDGVRLESQVYFSARKSGGRIAGLDLLGPRVISSHCGGETKASLGDRIKDSVVNRYKDMGGSLRLTSWIEATVFGSRKSLSFKYVAAFKKTGLMHLLVVSGLHVGLFAGFTLWLVRMPFQFLYAATMIDPGRWKRILVVTEILVSLFVAAYVILIGAPQAAQRAGVFFIVWIIGKNLFGLRRSVDRFAACMTIQVAIFPIGFLASGNILSWLVTLFLVESYQSKTNSEGDVWMFLNWRLQLKIMCLCAVLFSELSLLSLPANLVLAPAFAAMLYLTNFNIIFPYYFISQAVAAIVETYLFLIVKVASFTNKYPAFYLKLDGVPTLFRILALFCAGIVVLNSLRNLSIRSLDQKE